MREAVAGLGCSAAVVCSVLYLAARGPSLQTGASARLLYLALYYSRQAAVGLLVPWLVLAQLAARPRLGALLAELGSAPPLPPPLLLLFAAGLAFLSVLLPFLFAESLTSLPQGLSTFAAILLAGRLAHSIASLLARLGHRFAALAPALRSQSPLALAATHRRLSRLAVRLNRLLDLQILLLVWLSFLISVIYLYYIVFIHKLDNKLPLQLVAINVHYTSVAVAHLLFVHTIVSRVEILTKQARRFTLALYRLMLEDDTLSLNKTLRMHISSREQVVFTAAGFFRLDFALLHSMLAASTTYLVMLIQFGEMSSRPGSFYNIPSNTNSTS